MTTPVTGDDVRHVLTRLSRNLEAEYDKERALAAEKQEAKEYELASQNLVVASALASCVIAVERTLKEFMGGEVDDG